MHGKLFAEHAIRVLHLPTALAHLRIKLVAQNGEEPGFHIGPHLKGLLLGPRLHDRILNEIVRLVVLTDQRHSKSAQARQR